MSGAFVTTNIGVLQFPGIFRAGQLATAEPPYTASDVGLLVRGDQALAVPGTAFVPQTALEVWYLAPNIIQWGRVRYPAEYGFINGPNTYLVGDAGDTSSDVSFVMRTAGNARWEAGMVGAITDGVINQSYRIKEISGTYLSEVFQDRFVIHAPLSPRYPFVDFHAPAGEPNSVRLHATSGVPMFVIGNSNGEASPTGTGSGLEISYSTVADIARFTAITHDQYYRDIVYEANNHRWSSGPVFLNVDAMRLNSQGALLLNDPIQYAVSCFVSNAGAAGLALMSGYVPGTDVLTALGGTGTAPTFNLTNTQISRVNSIAAAGTGGTPGAVVLTGTTGTGTKFQVNGTISAGGALTAVGAITVRGDYTVNPTTLSAEPVTGGGLVGAQLNISMGALTLTLATAGALTVTPKTPVSTSSSGAGTGATLDITYQAGLGAINVSDAIYDDGTAPTGTLGSGYVRASAATLTLPRISGGTVAALPAAGTAGRRAYVTDATVTTFASVVAGGGANVVPVFDNGTNWIIG